MNINEKFCFNCFKNVDDDAAVCPHCGFDPSKNADYSFALPMGSILEGKYIIGRVLGQGGFGITYAAYDVNIKGKVAIKEYFPSGMTGRSSNSVHVTVSVRTQEEAYNSGLDGFVTEARTLMKLSGHPNIVKIYECFKENNTAYYVMDYVDGINFKSYIKSKGGKLKWQEAAELLMPVIDALDYVHTNRLVHRDVSPDNIFITDDKAVKLLDFGSARNDSSEGTKTMDVVLKQGYAPPEQYLRRSRQGAYTDIYSLCATFYAAVTGYVPPEALERMDKDELASPSKYCPDIPRALADVILKGLSVDYHDRWQSARELKAAIERAASDPSYSVQSTPPSQPDPQSVTMPVNRPDPASPPSVQPPVQPPKSKKTAGIIFSAAAVLIVCVIVAVSLVGKNDSQPASGSSSGSDYELLGSNMPSAENFISDSDEVSGEVSWENNVMMSDPHRDDLNTSGDPVIGSSTISREDITSIEVLGTLKNAPSSAWDISEKGDGSVMAWVENEKLYIAGEGGVCAPENCESLFESYTSMTSINFNGNFHTSKTTDMNSMFRDCLNLKSIVLDDAFNVSHVVDTSLMFCNCRNLTTLNLGNNFNTEAVTNMEAMFSLCVSLQSLDLGSNFNTSKVTNMKQMFSDNVELRSISLGDNFNTEKVNDMSGMFMGCNKLNSLNLGNEFDTSEVITMAHMFDECYNISSLDLGDKFYTSKVKEMQYMFYCCTALKDLDTGDHFDASNVENLSYMFYNCSVQSEKVKGFWYPPTADDTEMWGHEIDGFEGL